MVVSVLREPADISYSSHPVTFLRVAKFDEESCRVDAERRERKLNRERVCFVVKQRVWGTPMCLKLLCCVFSALAKADRWNRERFWEKLLCDVETLKEWSILRIEQKNGHHSVMCFVLDFHPTTVDSFGEFVVAAAKFGIQKKCSIELAGRRSRKKSRSTNVVAGGRSECRSGWVTCLKRFLCGVQMMVKRTCKRPRSSTAKRRYFTSSSSNVKRKWGEKDAPCHQFLNGLEIFSFFKKEFRLSNQLWLFWEWKGWKLKAVLGGLVAESSVSVVANFHRFVFWWCLSQLSFLLSRRVVPTLTPRKEKRKLTPPEEKQNVANWNWKWCRYSDGLKGRKRNERNLEEGPSGGKRERGDWKEGTDSDGHVFHCPKLESNEKKRGDPSKGHARSGKEIKR